MTDAIQAFTFSPPVQGNVNNIFFHDCELGWSDVSQIVLVFPPGCAGLIHVRLEVGGQQIYPLKSGTFFALDDFTLVIPVSGAGQSGQWHVAGYNEDIYEHTIQAYFFYDYLDASTQGDSSSPLVGL